MRIINETNMTTNESFNIIHFESGIGNHQYMYISKNDILISYCYQNVANSKYRFLTRLPRGRCNSLALYI